MAKSRTTFCCSGRYKILETIVVRILGYLNKFLRYELYILSILRLLECKFSFLTSYKTLVSRQSYPSPPGLLSGSWHRGCAPAPRRKGLTIFTQPLRNWHTRKTRWPLTDRWTSWKSCRWTAGPCSLPCFFFDWGLQWYVDAEWPRRGRILTIAWSCYDHETVTLWSQRGHIIILSFGWRHPHWARRCIWLLGWWYARWSASRSVRWWGSCHRGRSVFWWQRHCGSHGGTTGRCQSGCSSCYKLRSRGRNTRPHCRCCSTLSAPCASSKSGCPWTVRAISVRHSAPCPPWRDWRQDCRNGCAHPAE